MNSRQVIVPRAAGWVAAVAASFALSSCGDRNATAPAPPPSSVAVVASPTPGPDGPATPAVTKTTKTPVTIYRVITNAEGEGELEPVESEIDVNDPTAAVRAVNMMADAADSPLPKGTRAISVRFDPDQSLATVDLSSEFESNFEGGDKREALMFNALLGTLGQFPNVHKVQLLVQGKKVSIGGTQDTQQPLDIPKELVASAKHE